MDDDSLLSHVLFEAVVADVTASEDHFQALCSIVLLNEADFHFLDQTEVPLRKWRRPGGRVYEALKRRGPTL